MLLFRSEEHVRRWCRARDILQGGIMTPEQGWMLAQAWYADKLSPAWRRKSVEESEAVLRDVGLLGPFWSLKG